MKGSLPSNAANNHMPERGWTETSTALIAANSLQNRRWANRRSLFSLLVRRAVRSQGDVPWLDCPSGPRKEKMATGVLKMRSTVA